MTDNSDDNDPFLEPPWLTIAPDHPISEKTPGADRFDLGLRIGPIYDILRHPETRTPMAAAIYGDWGAGKTSAMKWLDGRLRIWNEQGAPDGKIKVHSVWFYPWKYQTQEDVWRGLVAQVIIACLDTKDADAKDYMEAAKDLGAFLGNAFIDLVSGVKFSVGLAGAAKADLDLKSLQKIKENAKDSCARRAPTSTPSRARSKPGSQRPSARTSAWSSSSTTSTAACPRSASRSWKRSSSI